MEPVTIRKQIEIAASPAEVWRYIGSAAGLREWWQVEVKMEPQVGGLYIESSDLLNHAYQRRGEVTVYEPPHRLCVAFREVSGEERHSHQCELELLLTPADNCTVVTLLHRGFIVDERTVAIVDAVAVEVPVTGPRMALPRSVYSTAAPTKAPVSRSDLSQPPLQAPPDWQHQQNLLWLQRCAQLQRLFPTTNYTL